MGRDLGDGLVPRTAVREESKELYLDSFLPPPPPTMSMRCMKGDKKENTRAGCPKRTFSSGVAMCGDELGRHEVWLGNLSRKMASWAVAPVFTYRSQRCSSPLLSLRHSDQARYSGNPHEPPLGSLGAALSLVALVKPWRRQICQDLSRSPMWQL